MSKRTETRRDDPKQSERFIEAAHTAEADESKEGAERGFKKIDPWKKPKKDH
jgi:hypothetical protein